MLRLLLCCCVPIFAALPVLVEAEGHNIENLDYDGSEVLLSTFQLANGDGETPFAMQITFANGSKLKDKFNNEIHLTALKLKYKNLSGTEQPITLQPSNLQTINFSSTIGNLQQKYEFELLGSWNKQNANRIGGTFHENIYIEILPQP